MKLLMEVVISNGDEYTKHIVAHVFKKKHGYFYWSAGKSKDNFYSIGYKSSSELVALNNAIRYAIDLSKRIGGFKFVEVIYSTGKKVTYTCVNKLFDSWDIVNKGEI